MIYKGSFSFLNYCQGIHALILFNFCMCAACVCVCTCVCMWICALCVWCTHTQGQDSMSGTFLYYSPSCCLETGSLIGQGACSSGEADWAVSSQDHENSLVVLLPLSSHMFLGRFWLNMPFEKTTYAMTWRVHLGFDNIPSNPVLY